MDRGAWQATVHGVTQRQIQLERLSAHAHILGRKRIGQRSGRKEGRKKRKKEPDRLHVVANP